MEINNKRHLVNAAIIVMSATVFSRITGFLREILIPNMLTVKYGASVSDAFVQAFRTTDPIYNMLLGGAMSAALIPFLAGSLSKGKEEEGWKAASTFFNVLTIAMAFACMLGIIFAPQLVPILAPGFKAETAKLTVRLARILFPSVGFLMLAGMCNGVLNSYQRFAASVYGPVVYNLGGILSIFLLSNYGVETVTYGVMCSSFIYFLVQLSFTIKNMKFYRPVIYLADSGFRRLLGTAVPSLLSSSIIQINTLITSIYVTFFGVGSATALNMADRLWQLPLGIFAQSMGIALLPTLSAKAATGDKKEFENVLFNGMKTILFATIPSSVGFIVLNTTIISSIFKLRKNIDPSIFTKSGQILTFFAIALLAQSVINMINRAFYAHNDTKTTLYVGASTILFNIALSTILKNTGLGVAGMSLAYSSTSVINMILLLFLFKRKIEGISYKKLASFIFQSVPSALIMGVAIYFLNEILPGIARDYTTKALVVQLARLLVIIGTGGIVYLASMLIIFKNKEAVNVTGRIREKLLKKFSVL